MLEQLRIQNFKSWQDTGDMAFGRLTGFFGTNSSGKSSILQFLLMLKQTVESSDRSRVLHLGDDKSYVDLGTVYDVIYQRLDPAEIAFEITWKTLEEEIFSSRIARNFSWSPYSNYFECKIKRQGDKSWLDSFFYKIQKMGAKLQANGLDETNNKPTYNFTTTGFSDLPTEAVRFSQSYIEINKFYAIPSGFALPSGQYSELYKWVFSLEQFFNRSYYLGPLREYPSRLYVWAGEQTQSVGNRGERAVAALLSSRNDGPTIDMGPDQPKRTVEAHVAYWLKELGLIYSFVVQPIAPNRKEYEVRIQRTAESASVFLTDVGFGVSQILPVLVLLFYVPEGSTVILEQPEIHLHPAVQAGLADVFLDAIQRRKLQIVLESHSEHLLQRLQLRLAEGVIETEAIKLYFTSIKAGRSELTPLELDEYGNIGNWPAGFFGDTLGDAAAMMKAEMKRRMGKQQA